MLGERNYCYSFAGDCNLTWILSEIAHDRYIDTGKVDGEIPMPAPRISSLRDGDSANKFRTVSVRKTQIVFNAILISEKRRLYGISSTASTTIIMTFSMVFCMIYAHSSPSAHLT